MRVADKVTGREVGIRNPPQAGEYAVQAQPDLWKHDKTWRMISIDSLVPLDEEAEAWFAELAIKYSRDR